MKQDTPALIKKNKSKILEKWMKNQLADDGLRDDLMSNEDLREQSEELINAFVDALNVKNISSPASEEFDEVLEIVSGLSISRAQQGYTAKEIGLFVISLKEAILQVLEENLKEDGMALYRDAKLISGLFDHFSIVTYETFIKGREDVILRQTDEISEISTPVIRVWDGILALPIIGTLDSSRTQIVMENLLEAIVETGSTIAILDISGVPAVDSLVAQHLMKTVAATRLMGAECVISGIRPEIAQTIVHLGIDLSNIITKASLASALKYSFASLKLEVKRQSLKAI